MIFSELITDLQNELKKELAQIRFLIKKNPGLAYNRIVEIGKEVVAVDPRYFRPTEVDLLIGDATKAKELLGWVPKYELKDLVKDMMKSDLHLMQKDTYLKDGGYKIMNYFE